MLCINVRFEPRTPNFSPILYIPAHNPHWQFQTLLCKNFFVLEFLIKFLIEFIFRVLVIALLCAYFPHLSIICDVM